MLHVPIKNQPNSNLLCILQFFQNSTTHPSIHVYLKLIYTITEHALQTYVAFWKSITSSSAISTNAVSDKFISAAICCLTASSKAISSKQTAAGFPEKAVLVKASTYALPTNSKASQFYAEDSTPIKSESYNTPGITPALNNK